MEFGLFGGQFVQGDVLKAVQEIEKAYEKYHDDEAFLQEFQFYLKEYANRPSLLYYAKHMSEDLGGAKVYLKREDLNHTGSHKINNVIGQALLAKRMGKKKLIAETGAGQHGVATATIAALFGMECDIYMGCHDIEKQSLNAFKIDLLGARIISVTKGLGTLKEAVDEALVAWSKDLKNSFYLIGSAVGPHPFPTMVRDFQKVIGEEIKSQILVSEDRLPDAIIACVGGGSNSIGAFYDFLNNPEVKLIGVEAAGKGIETKYNAATLTLGEKGILHGMHTMVLKDENGEVREAYSISAGLDYPGVGPEHSHLFNSKRAEYVTINDEEAVLAFEYLSKVEGIIPAIESSHALAYAIKLAPRMKKDQIIVVNLSGRGDKDVYQIAKYRGIGLINQ
jgi:tryptophan synthase beta chain